MFTGIIEATSKVIGSKKDLDNLEVEFTLPKDWDIHEGDSVNTNGVCLTVNELKKSSYICVLMPETLRVSSLGQHVPEVVNLERSLKLSDRLDGHIVQGHVDAVGTVKEIKPGKRSLVIIIGFDKIFSSLVVVRGSISIDGVSLTVADCGDDWLSVSLVDYTLKHTTLGTKKNGDLLNIEFDILGKYILKSRQSTGKQRS